MIGGCQIEDVDIGTEWNLKVNLTLQVALDGQG